MKTKYQIIVAERFFDDWLKDIKTWKQKTELHSDGIFLLNMIDEFLNKSEINKILSTKYHDFTQEVYQRYITHIKNQIYKILPLAEEGGYWRKHLDTLINELQGASNVFIQTINFISLISKLETLKQFSDIPSSLSLAEMQQTEEFKLFRKTIFECMNIVDTLGDVIDNGN